MKRIYLDNAATSFPKPDCVWAAVKDYNRRLGSAVGRGAYRAGIDATALVERCRKRVAGLLRAESPDRIVFTFNGTDSLNLALHGALRAGDHVVTSVMEHNSVLRPLSELRRRMGIEVSHVPADAGGLVDPAGIRRALRPNTRLIALVHASNVTGAIQPIAEAGRIARESGALFLIDAAQSAGSIPIDLSLLPVDLLACPGHKGLLGPLGTGILYIRPGVDENLASLRQGGTGTQSEQDVQPEALPEKYESGNHNAPGLVGLEASVGWLLERGVEQVHRHEQALVEQLLESLSAIPSIRLFGAKTERDRVGVVSLAVDGFEPQDVAAILDQNFGVEVRAGLHCAPLAHRAIGSFSGGGTVRLSVGPFTTSSDIEAAAAALRQITESTI